jgi:hypothetical protein
MLMKLGILPVLTTDGLILPFERFLHYESFTAKLLHRTYSAPRHLRRASVVPIFEAAARIADSCRAVCSKQPNTQPSTLLLRKQGTAQSAHPWLNWFSEDTLANPFTLAVLEIMCFSEKEHRPSLCILPRSVVAKREYFP